MTHRAPITIGTSGWSYPHWVGNFYPADLPRTRWLDHYANGFRSVELNSTFYRLPAPEIVRRWTQHTPDGFVFALKASRYITHLKKLNDCREAIQRVIDVADALGEKLGPVLFQLPPRWRVNTTRLQAFMSSLPASRRYVFEFRDRSWWIEEVYALLRQQRMALCQFSLADQVSPEVLTSDVVYVRLHGPRPGYAGSYSDKTLRTWAQKLLDWQRDGCSCFVYFDNDEGACAVHDARRLIELCSAPDSH